MKTVARSGAPFCVAVVVCTICGQACADNADLAFLLEGVAQIGAPGVPGPLCVFGDDAFPVVTGSANGAIHEPVVAAGRRGQGRVVAFGHPGYFDRDTLAMGDTGRLMANAVRWAAGETRAGGAGPRVAVHKQPGLLAFLREQGLTAEAWDDAGWAQKLSACDVLCVDPVSVPAAPDLAALTQFVRAGGGLVAAQLGWGWLQLNPGKSLRTDHPGNRLLAPAGIVWADGYLERTTDVGYRTGYARLELTHAGRALDAVVAHTQGGAQLGADDLAQAAWSVTQAARWLPPEDQVLLPRLHRLQREHATDAIPTPQTPLTTATPLARLALTLQLEEMERLAPEELRAHPAAAAFPGSVPEQAERVARTIQVDTSVPGWHSTGLYAAPGEVIEVQVPEAAAGKGLLLRIGAHSDSLWSLSSWHRCPEICRQQPLAKPVTHAASAFGGLVYVEVPDGCKLGAIPIATSGAVEAPHFVLGKTELAQWRAQVRHRPAPWAELETTKVILTLPSEVVRKLDDPEELLRFWDLVLDCNAELAQRPLERERPERYVTDVQISAGYMHSGCPIMTHLDMAEVMVDKPRIIAKAVDGVWGLFHEMGHNHQSGDWTFAGAGEVTCNLFTLYVFDKACNMPPKAHSNFTDEARRKKLQAYLAAGAQFEQWKRDPFLALLMYIQLQEAFGWDPFKAVFAEYRHLRAEERPQNDDEKRDQWMVRFSRTVGRNLGPFFQAWGVPTSEQARASIAHLPVWMPDDFPPK